MSRVDCKRASEKRAVRLMSASIKGRRQRELKSRKRVIACPMSGPEIIRVGGLDTQSGNQVLLVQAVISAASGFAKPTCRSKRSKIWLKKFSSCTVAGCVLREADCPPHGFVYVGRLINVPEIFDLRCDGLPMLVPKQ